MRSFAPVFTLSTLLAISLVSVGGSHHEGSRSRREVIDGDYESDSEDGWSEWSEPSICSKTCGIGVQYRERFCTIDGPDGCEGPNRAYNTCNTQDCPPGTPDYRAEQCSRYDNVEFDGKSYEWIPYFGDNNCELNCYAKGENFYHRHAATVVDGTRCNQDKLDICINGACENIGCDRELGSDMEYDKCHLCGGDGSECKTVEGHVHTHHMKTGYHDIVLIPTGSTSIHFREIEASKANLLALRTLEGDYLLNGNFLLHPEGKLNIAGTTFYYEHNPQSLQSDGPTTHPLYAVLLRQHGESYKINYEYSIPLTIKSGSKETYEWQGGDWSECSNECAGGIQTRNVSCVRASDEEVVGEELCRPFVNVETEQECNTHACPASWHHGQWEKCSATCGQGVQVRTVFCQQLSANGFYRIVEASHCDGQEKPGHFQHCNDVPCPEWETDEWSRCNRVCGPGHQTRTVICRAQHPIPNARSDVLPDQRCSGERPQSRQECNRGPCTGVEWVVSAWSECRGTCEKGYETRQVVCSSRTGKVQPNGMCDPGRKPEVKRACTVDEEKCQPRPKWHASQWSVCSSRCGPGKQYRQVFCAKSEEDSLVLVDDLECDSSIVMPARRECNGTDCRGSWFSGPWGKCSKGCGGGQQRRDVMCFAAYMMIDNTECDPANQPAIHEECNTGPCEDGEEGLVGDQIPAGLCIESYFGCCMDGVTQAQGPFHYGCPEFTCKETVYGCCSDGHTSAGGPDQEGCPTTFSCQSTAFGCCDDGITPANGFNKEGCDSMVPHVKTCAHSVYGCCADGVTAAEGPVEEGCDGGSGELAPCENTPFGCCADGVTAARGPKGAGCNEILSDCEAAVYGCCPDGFTAADGPNFRGCPGMAIYPGDSSCDNTLYGCCPDGTVAALGPGGEGCENIIFDDCDRTVYGCCPDGRTVAEGPHNEGCSVACETSQFGCCPDGATPAESATYHGCPNVVATTPCELTTFGCCPDHVTPARGPGFRGCPDITRDAFECARTTYGCCLDGSTIATGDNFNGCEEEGSFIYSCTYSPHGCCPDGETPSSGPNNAGCPHKVLAGAACGLPEERGPCSNYSVKWYFDPVYGDCSRFWYGGCDGNDNRFETKEACQARCNTPDGELDKCYLPKSPGRCSASSEKFYYNAESHQCEKFVYGGCLGNANRFETSEECAEKCAVPHKSDVCELPYQTGPCRGSYERFFYDRDNDMCRQFIYGGCKGNDNRFDNAAGCEQRCMQPTEKVCQMPKVSGACEAIIQKWYFNTAERKCEEFTYGGCEGNGNRFSSQEECERTCHEFLVTKEVDVCIQPKDSGPCKAYFERWYYDQGDGFCKQFVYGGCEGNGNRFETEQDCRNTCSANEPVDVCTLPAAAGPCRASMPRYHMDAATGQCREFIFGGCDGNENNFETLEECEKSCHSYVRPAVEGKGHCSLPAEGGPCLASMLRYYYDSAEAKCKKFLYGGCEGNRNRFISDEACLTACHDDDGDRSTEEVPTPQPTDSPAGPIADLCRIPHNPGPCYNYQIWWYYDPQYTACRRFYYGGCGGNTNRFASESECERRCGDDDVCSQPQETGSCLAYIPAWSYDQERDVCLQFVYGGCEGNDNRFDTEEACRTKCSVSSTDTTGLAACAMKYDSGPCRDTETRWYYDSGEGRCMRFLYGGCEGNQNNFVSENECDDACSAEDVCNLPSETGPCRAAKNRYYYNSASEKCEEFIYGGCAGNANRFMTKEACSRTCEAEEEKQGPEPAIVVSSPATAPETPSSDRRIVDSHICTMGKDPGPCDGYEPVWYFEPNTKTCRRFLYGGCEGNDNRFASRDECRATCVDATPSAGPSNAPTPSASPLPVDPSASDTPEDDEDICMKKPDEGKYCTGWEMYWYFDSTLANCRRFYWGGCDGNQNRFQTQEHCEGHCMSVRKQTTQGPHGDQAGCYRPVDKGPCNELITRWYYDIPDDMCKQFYYGGCGGNENNFLSENGCIHHCDIAAGSGSPEQHLSSDVCLLPFNKGPCGASQHRWYYDPTVNACKDFVFGGCEGNANNFATQKKCVSVCKLNFVQGSDNICEMPQDQGPCFALQLRWFFNKDSQRCTQFQYGGCQGNLNNFKSEKECQESCGSQEEESSVEKKSKDSCRLSVDAGPCFVDYLRYYFDETVGECRPFTYGGCQGNSNNFESQTECYSTCGDGLSQYKINKPGDCYAHPAAGSCEGAEPRWHFDASRGDCLAFYYGGCAGNGNNFRTYDDCIAMCSRETCGVLQCNLECPLGFARGPDGCQLCRCLNPCDEKRCPLGTECQIQEIQCVTTPCLPDAVCVATARAGECPPLDPSDPAVCITECDEDADCGDTAKCCSSSCGKICVQPELPDPNAKPGFCPPLQPGLATTCENLCNNDMDCPENGKCCSTGCGMICMPALYLSSDSGCVNSVYGCCPDNKTPAGGWNLQGCTEEAPSIREDDTDLVANVGAVVVIPCHAYGVPVPQVSWFRNRVPILTSATVDEEEGYALLADGSLEITNADVEDSTTYSCRAFNGLGAATRTYMLLVQVPVSFDETPTEVTVGVGERAKLPCSASGNPVPAIRWMQNGQVIPMDDHYSVAGRGGLLIEEASVVDEGHYVCEADNGVGYPVLRTVSLKVATTFSVSIEVFNETYAVGEELHLKCTLVGASLMIEWSKDGEKLASEARIMSTNDGDLFIGDVQSKDAGLYTCSASRDGDTATAAAKIDVLGVMLPEDCMDKPWYADCNLIVEAQMCRHPYFSVFCCKSCHEAGHLP